MKIEKTLIRLGTSYVVIVPSFWLKGKNKKKVILDVEDEEIRILPFKEKEKQKKSS